MKMGEGMAHQALHPAPGRLERRLSGMIGKAAVLDPGAGRHLHHGAKKALVLPLAQQNAAAAFQPEGAGAARRPRLARRAARQVASD